MFYKRKQQTKIIHSNTAEDFEERLNDYLSQLADLKVKYELSFNYTMGFCAYIIYTETVDIPESLAEEFEMRGEGHHCTECKHCLIPNDKRVKHFLCEVHGGKVSKASWCCDNFYQDMRAFMRGGEE